MAIKRHTNLKGSAVNPLEGKVHEHFFPIVGIGASAGGLEALERFLQNVPENSGLAFVIVQHLDPTRTGLMPELLKRATPMNVIQVKDRTVVQPNCVYVIPPNKDMSILHGILHLLVPTAIRGLRLPIDFFFRALADDQQEQSIGVILSGMGSDGTQGLKAIKEKAGLVFVQAPTSAKFDSMPRSAIDAGLGDVVAPVEELPAKIIAVLQHVPLLTNPAPVLEDKTLSALGKIFILLRTHTGHDFSLYKSSTLHRRIARRMGIHQISGIANYVKYLQDNAQELDLLFQDLLIGVTRFFRDPAAWEQLATEALPALLAERPSSHALRAWAPGCSTGEEAYSLAMVFKEVLEKKKIAGKYTLQIFATDLDKESINKARHGSYLANIAADVSPARLSRFFVKEDVGYRIRKEIREMVVFAPQNLIKDPPFTKLDLLLCRNLLIYLEPELQKKILPLFSYSLNPGGILFLGSAESLGTLSHLFAAFKGKSRLFRRSELTPGGKLPDMPVLFTPALTGQSQGRHLVSQAPNLQTLSEQLLLQQYAPAAVLTNRNGDILFISGQTGHYLEPAAGKANFNVLAMARTALRYELSGAFAKALRRKGPLTIRNLKGGTNADVHMVDVTIQPLETPESLRGMVLVVFTAVPPPPPAPKTLAPGAKRASIRNRHLDHTRQELQQAHQQIQVFREEMESTHEELQSTNEELQSTNEELQSTNEELATSKEEMQSANEELQTINQEQQAKMLELSQINSDMKNLLNSTDIACVFLDHTLCLRRFTPQATKIIHLLPGDVGRPMTDIVSYLQYPALAEDAREVLRTLAPIEKQVATGDGRWYLVRIMPYFTMENMIDGLAVTFINITASKTLEASLRLTSTLLTTVIENIHDAYFSLDHNLAITALNPAAERLLNRTFAAVGGRPLCEAFPEAKGSSLDAKCQEALREKTALSFEAQFASARYQGCYDVRIHPHAGGLSILLQVPANPTASTDAAAIREASHEKEARQSDPGGRTAA